MTDQSREEVAQYDFQGAKVRAVVIDGEPALVGKDVCEALGIKNSRDALNRLDKDGVGIADVTDSLGRSQQTTVLKEPALYELAFQSRVPQAKEFRNWVTHEVLPSIRKHGGYLTPEKIEEVLLNPDTIISLANQLKNEQAKVKELTPKAGAWETFCESSGDMSVADTAKAFKARCGVLRTHHWWAGWCRVGRRSRGFLGRGVGLEHLVWRMGVTFPRSFISSSTGRR